MNVTTLVWSKVKLHHYFDRVKRKEHIDLVPEATIKIYDGFVTIRDTAEGSWRAWTLAKCKLINLTPWGIELEAEWIPTDAEAATEVKHTVKVSAKF